MAFKFGSTNISAFKYGSTAISRLYQGSTQIWSAASDPTALLLRFNGSDSSTTFVNEAPSGAAVTPYGGAQISTTVSKFGGSSAFFNGYDAYLEASCAINWANDFTIEFWFYRAGTSSQGIDTLFEAGNIQGGQGGLHIYVDSNGDFFANDGFVGAIAGGSAPISSWVHVAFVRASGTNTLYVDGVAVGTSQQDFSASVTNNIVRIGGAPNYGFYAYGYIDEFKLLAGSAIYTSNFVPPEVTLLMHFDTNFADSSSTAAAFMAAGNATTDPMVSQFGGASAYFDGNSSFISTPVYPNISFGTGDFTVEAWVYRLFGGEDRFRIAGLGAGPNGSSPPDTTGWAFWIRDGGYLWFYRYDGVDETYFSTTATVPLNTWTHVAVTRFNGVLYLFIDGVLDRSVSAGLSYDHVESADPDANLFYVGAIREAGTWRYTYGYVDELRIIKGYAAYTTNFTPPTAPF